MMRRRYLLSILSAEMYRKLLFANLYHDIIPSTIADRKARNNGKTSIVKIEGNGEIENLLLDTTLYQLRTHRGVTSTLVGSALVLNGTNDGTGSSDFDILPTSSPTSLNNIIYNHKYLILVSCKNIVGTITLCGQFQSSGFPNFFSPLTLSNGLQAFFTTDNFSSATLCEIWVRVPTTNTNTLNNVQIETQLIDLTQEFGTGNEPTSLDDKRIRRIIAKGYCPHNTGTYNSTTIQEIETKGFNVFDEQTELGAISDVSGQNASNDTQIRTKNYIRVEPDTQYYCRSPNYDLQFRYYDANFNYLGNADKNGQTNGHNVIRTMPSNCHYLRFVFPSLYGTTYLHDICINRSGARNGEYVPFATFNIWNEDWELGALNIETGQATASTVSLCSSSFSSCKPNETYYVNHPTIRTGYNLFICWYDSNKTYLGYVSAVDNNIVSPSNAYYFKISFEYYLADYGTYDHDICINKSCEKNGLYLPFGVLDIIQLPQPLKLDGALNAHNTFEITKDAFVFTRNVWNYTFTGNETWTAISNNNGFYATVISNARYDATKITTLSELGQDVTYNDIYNGTAPSGIATGGSGNNRIMIGNDLYTNRASLTGKTLYYELATPQVINIPRKHLGCVRLKDLVWAFNGANVFKTSNVISNIKIVAVSIRFNGYCSKYSTSDVQYITDKSIGSTNGYLYVKDTSANENVNTFIASLTDNDILFYETENEVDDFVNEATYQKGGTINGLQPNIPVEYQEVEYIESSGTQYIDSGIKPNQDTKTILKCKVAELPNVDNALFDTRETRYGLFLTFGGNNQFNTYDYSGSSQVAQQFNTTDVFVVELKNKLVINGTEVYDKGSLTFTCQNNLFFFAGNNNGSANWYSKYKMYSLKIMDGSTLVRDFIPCYRKSDGVIGLYDKVEGKFYTNAGTGTFLKGANVNGSYTCEVLPNYEGKFQVK